MSATVNEELLLGITDCDTLDEIRVISLREKQLSQCLKVLSKCDNLTIAYLQNNQINLKDMTFLHNFRNLKKIDLSDNLLEGLPQPQVFAGLHSLQFLYLHNNKLTKWQDLQSLTSLPQIMHITLFNNPVCQIPGYRHFIVNSIPCLKALDNFVITDEERIEDASFGYRFRGLNEFMKLHIPDYRHERSAENHLFNLEVDVYRLKRIFERNSPSILIQSLYRGYRSRNTSTLYFQERLKFIKRIQAHVRGFINRRKYLRELQQLLVETNQTDLLLSNEQINIRDKGRIIFTHMYAWYKMNKRNRIRLAATIKIQTYFRMRLVKNSSFVNALQLIKFPRIYFLKEQKPQFLKILKSLRAILEQEQMTVEDAVSCIREDNQFETIRIEEPDLFVFQSLPLLQFIKPTIGGKTLIRENQTIGLDKMRQPEFSLKKCYFSRDYERTNQMLRILQKRYCHENPEAINQILKLRREKVALDQMVFFDKYNDFLVFEGRSLSLILSVLFAILDYNRSLKDTENQQFLCFFEPLLRKQAMACKIQQAWRAHRWRMGLKLLPIELIIQQRAARCVNDWWQKNKIIKKSKALTNIKNHVNKIKSCDIYIEQTIYQNINKIVSESHSAFRFKEQAIMFDFNPSTFGVHMAVEEVDSNYPRFQQVSVPRWFGVKLTPPDFISTPYMNNLLALFHFNQGDCTVLPTTHIVNYNNCQMDIDRNLFFVKMQCSSVEEAQKRALVLAYLTYDMTRHIFVKLNTGTMLENPYDHQNVYEVQELYNLQVFEEPVDLAMMIAKQQQQQHQGMILTDKDAKALQQSNQFKSVELNEKFLNVSLPNLGNETGTINMGPQDESKDSTKHISLYESQKLNDQHIQTLKQQRFIYQHRETQQFKADKLALQERTLQFEFEKEIALKQEVIRQREIKKIIKQEQATELVKNLSVFVNLNAEERLLRSELVDKQSELQFKEKQLKIANIVHQAKIRALKKEEREKFVGSFAQAKNLIDKQMKIGNHMRQLKKVKMENKTKVAQIKKMKAEDQLALPLKTKVYGGFNEAFDASTNFSQNEDIPNNRSQSSQLGHHQQHGHDFAARNNESYISQQQLRQNNGLTVDKRNNMSSAKFKQRHQQLLPPLNETNFSEQYKQFRGVQQNIHLPPISNRLEMSRDLQEIIKSNISNKPHMKRQYQRPLFAEERYPLVPQNYYNSISGEMNKSGAGVFKVSGVQPYTPPYQVMDPVQMQPIFPLGASLYSSGNGGTKLILNPQASLGPKEREDNGSAYMSPLNPKSETNIIVR